MIILLDIYLRQISRFMKETHMSKVLRYTGLNKSVSISEVLSELRKIKRIRFGRKKIIISEMTKLQSKLFRAFDISPLL